MTQRTFFNNLPSTIPFEREDTNRYVPWIIAFIMYIALLASFSALILLTALDYWHPGSTKTFTLAIPFKKTSNLNKITQEEYTENRINKVINIISETPKVVQVSLLSEVEMHRLLKPWFSKKFNAYDVMLPSFLSIKVNTKDKAFFSQKLLLSIRTIEPKATIIKILSWQSIIEKCALKLQLFIAGLLLLILLAAAWTITFTTRTNMLMQRDIIELLTLLGATDDFIATRYKRKALLIAFESLAKALIGLILTVGIVWWITYEVDQQLFGRIILHLLNWKIIFLILIPIIIIFLMMKSAKRCVFNTLEELF